MYIRSASYVDDVKVDNSMIDKNITIDGVDIYYKLRHSSIGEYDSVVQEIISLKPRIQKHFKDINGFYFDKLKVEISDVLGHNCIKLYFYYKVDTVLSYFEYNDKDFSDSLHSRFGEYFYQAGNPPDVIWSSDTPSVSDIWDKLIKYNYQWKSGMQGRLVRLFANYLSTMPDKHEVAEYYFDNFVSESEMQRIENTGIAVDILVDRLSDFLDTFKKPVNISSLQMSLKRANGSNAIAVIKVSYAGRSVELWNSENDMGDNYANYLNMVDQDKKTSYQQGAETRKRTNHILEDLKLKINDFLERSKIPAIVANVKSERGYKSKGMPSKYYQIFIASTEDDSYCRFGVSYDEYNSEVTLAYVFGNMVGEVDMAKAMGFTQNILDNMADVCLDVISSYYED